MSQAPSVTLPLEAQVRALVERAGARARDDLRVVSVRGEDRVDWLNGMVTNEVKNLARGESRFTTIVHVKGKLLAEAYVTDRGDELWVIVPAGTVPTLLEHLNKYIVMEDVELAERAELHVVSVQGPKSAELTGEGTPGVRVPADRIGRGGVDVVAREGDEVRAVWDALAAQRVPPVDDAAWDVARLTAGVARWGVDYGTENYVQEANLTARAVSMNKGCYVGQEVVCRLEVRGHARRQLVALAMDGEAPAAGTKVTREGVEVGEVTSAVRSPLDGAVALLAMLKWDVVTSGSDVAIDGRPARFVARPGA